MYNEEAAYKILTDRLKETNFDLWGDHSEAGFAYHVIKEMAAQGLIKEDETSRPESPEQDADTDEESYGFIWHSPAYNCGGGERVYRRGPIKTLKNEIYKYIYPFGTHPYACVFEIHKQPPLTSPV